MNKIKNKTEIMNLETGEWLPSNKISDEILAFSTDKKTVNDRVLFFYNFKFDNVRIEKITRNKKTIYWAARYKIID